MEPTSSLKPDSETLDAIIRDFDPRLRELLSTRLNTLSKEEAASALKTLSLFRARCEKRDNLRLFFRLTCELAGKDESGFRRTLKELETAYSLMLDCDETVERVDKMLAENEKMLQRIQKSFRETKLEHKKRRRELSRKH